MKHWVRIAVLTPLFAVGCRSTTPPTPPPAAPAATPRVQTLLTEQVPESVGREVRMLTVEYPPGGKSSPHRHPGAVFVYVLEGSVMCGLDDGPARKYGQGEFWTERPGQTHRVSENASPTESAKLLVFFVTTPGARVVEPAGKP